MSSIRVHTTFVRAVVVAAAVGIGPRAARGAESAPSVDALRQMSQAVEALVTRVSPSVVQVLVTGYGPLGDGEHGDADVMVGRQRSLGSGVIVDGDGFIMTNAHVVSGAARVQVVVPTEPGGESPLRSLVSARGRTVDARVVGIAPEVDLALLKIDLTGLPALPLANYDDVRQGQMVFAFGSPEGLRNSVTMGVVSSVARQPDADHPMVYIQTDAPINHGNSGGPLVNVNGEVVGINAFILSESGGSQGLGFAIPSAIVGVAYPQLRMYGHLHRGEIGVDVQTITPEIARGLGLSKDWGLVVSDVLPGGPADAAGLRIEDVIESVDDQPMDSVLALAFHLYARNAGDHLALVVRRGADRLRLDVPVVERPHESERLTELVDPLANTIRPLGVVGVAVDEAIITMVPDLRIRSGVMVAARSRDARTADVSLSTGDIIHRVNGVSIGSLPELRAALTSLAPQSAVVLQVEREGKLTFVAFRLD